MTAAAAAGQMRCSATIRSTILGRCGS